MLRKLLLLPLVSSTVSAATFMSDFTVDNGGFNTAITGTTLTEMNGELTFSPDNQNQGAAIEINPSQLLGVTNTQADPLFFDFTFLAPDLSTGEELVVFFGEGSQSGFTFAFEGDSSLIAVGNNDQSTVLLEDLEAGQTVNFQVEFFALANGAQPLTLGNTTVSGGQNPGQINTAAFVIASTLDQTSDVELIAGATNLNSGQINDFTFQGISTQSNSGTITSFTVSDEPISIPTPIPEPSSAALLLLAGSSLLLRRKRA